MATTVTGKLNKEASVFQAGQDSTGFGLRIGVQYYDRETKQKEWTNYECAIFAKNGPQADFYKSALVTGSIVEVSGQQQKIKAFDGQNGTMLSIELIDAKVGYIGTAGSGQSNNTQAPAQNQGQQQRPAQQRPAPQAQQYQTGLPAGDAWDDDIGF